MNRRKFLSVSAGCGAHVLAMASFCPAATQRVFSPQDSDKVVATEKWGRLEQVHDGVWSLISTPFDGGDFTTVSNGGIIAGKDRTMVVEAFMQDAGAQWMAKMAKKLTGRMPTDIVCTHYHADHTGGHRGFMKGDQKPKFWLTKETYDAALKSLRERQPQEAGAEKIKDFDYEVLATDSPSEIDLGDRKVKVVPRVGHTASDVTIEVSDPDVVFCGDLFFNRMFPNYSDATPGNLNKYAAEMLAKPEAIYVPGHGPVADLKALEGYQAFLKHIQTVATSAFEAGTSAEDATKDFKLPEPMANWNIWSPQVAKNGFAAWYRELEKK